jgi:hypothetical protein
LERQNLPVQSPDFLGWSLLSVHLFHLILKNRNHTPTYAATAYSRLAIIDALLDKSVKKRGGENEEKKYRPTWEARVTNGNWRACGRGR